MGEGEAPPVVGTRVCISGTGTRWAGQHFIATVVDVRESDATVKVRYMDGGFKRFSEGEFQRLVSERLPAPETWTARNPVVGQHLYILGTGDWWAGQRFGVTIVDIRESDATVKVRYTDGGFKRFRSDVFQTLVTERPPAPRMWEEWDTSSFEDDGSDMTRLHDKIMRAVKKRDFPKASELQREFRKLSAWNDTDATLRVRLTEAVNSGDYLEAHRLQQLIGLASGIPGQVSIGQPKLLDGPSQTTKQGYADVLHRGLIRALGGGIAGASAMVLQVGTLMWLRTIMNYQYRHGVSAREALTMLYTSGGVPRLYQGIGPALLQGPLLRFGDTAANAGVLALFEDTEARDWPVWVKTIFASFMAAAMRTALVPVDTVKTVMQVEGKKRAP